MNFFYSEVWTWKLLGVRRRQPLKVPFDRHRGKCTCSEYFYRSSQNFLLCSIFRKFNFRHRLDLRKLNPYENNRLYGSCLAMFRVAAFRVQVLFFLLVGFVYKSVPTRPFLM